MLENAKKYEEKLRQLFFDVAYDPFYQYEQFMSYREDFKLPEDTFNSHCFASVFRNEVIGMISYQIKRVENIAWGLRIIHFGGSKALPFPFGKDVMTAIKDIFEKYNFNKLGFGVAVGNPIEKTYDKLIKRYNGRIVGIREQEIKLLDGKLYDTKEYEILASNYFNRKNSIHSLLVMI
jgi:hypothetical protein